MDQQRYIVGCILLRGYFKTIRSFEQTFHLMSLNVQLDDRRDTIRTSKVRIRDQYHGDSSRRGDLYQRVRRIKLRCEPETYKQAFNSPDSSKWKKVMDDEVQSLESNNTWILGDSPHNRRAQRGKRVFNLKRGLGSTLVVICQMSFSIATGTAFCSTRK